VTDRNSSEISYRHDLNVEKRKFFESQSEREK